MCPPVAAAGRGPLPPLVPTGSVAECSSFASISLDAPAVSFACIMRYLRVPSERDSCGSRLHSPHLENSTSDWDAPSIEQARRGSFWVFGHIETRYVPCPIHGAPSGATGRGPPQMHWFREEESRPSLSVPRDYASVLFATRRYPHPSLYKDLLLWVSRLALLQIWSASSLLGLRLSLPLHNPPHAFSCLVRLPESNEESTTPSRLDVAPRKERSYGCPLPLVRQCIARRL
jgi:hypothetical protein